MADQRFDRIEKELKELGPVLEERITKRMEEMLVALAIKLQPPQGEGQSNSVGY
jgi:hypothetical protein